MRWFTEGASWLQMIVFTRAVALGDRQCLAPADAKGRLGGKASSSVSAMQVNNGAAQNSNRATRPQPQECAARHWFCWNLGA